MSVEVQIKLMKWLETFMQVSILIPMVVAWRGQRNFTAPIRLVSKYVYLSAISVISGKLAAYYFHNNLLVLVGFNLGKMLLFVAVYAQVLAATRGHALLRRSVVVVLCIAAGLLFYNWHVAANAARIMQVTVLAGYALVYLDQMLQPEIKSSSANDPMWLLSVANLLYAACTVTAATLGIFFADMDLYYFVCISFASLIFNCFLTVALLRARSDEAVLSNADATATSTLANA